jgi:glucuronyl/N-acetylglucosaminyl transferase EXT2
VHETRPSLSPWDGMPRRTKAPRHMRFKSHPRSNDNLFLRLAAVVGSIAGLVVLVLVLLTPVFHRDQVRGTEAGSRHGAPASPFAVVIGNPNGGDVDISRRSVRAEEQKEPVSSEKNDKKKGAAKDVPSLRKNSEERPPPNDGVAAPKPDAPADPPPIPKQLPRKSLPLLGSSDGSESDPLDYDRYTVRINSWKRQDQLRLSINHLLSCGDSSSDNRERPLAEVQVVWCTAQGPPPDWLLHMQNESRAVIAGDANASSRPRVTVEPHEINSLNERFNILSPVSTAAVLSVDDDVLRPCVALDEAFLKWRRQPHRIVGFDARTIVVDENHDNTRRLKYGYLSTTQNTNRYSLTLMRFAFVHQHYLRTYMSDLPLNIRDFVDTNLNCEDIAMSLWVSYQTDNLPPLLADFWAMKAMVKLDSASAISSTGNHKSVRDQCVHDFVQQLRLSVSKLQSQFVHYGVGEAGRPDQFWFDCGADEVNVSSYQNPVLTNMTKHLQSVHDTVHRWKTTAVNRGLKRELNDAVGAMSLDAYQQGYLKNTDPWRAKIRARHQQQQLHAKEEDEGPSASKRHSPKDGAKVGVDIE